MEYFIYATLWVGYFLLHSFLAANGVKELAYKSGFSPKMYRLIYVLISVGAFFGVMGYGATIDQDPLMAPSGTSKFIGLVLATSGIFIIKAAFKEYSLRSFIGIKEEGLGNLKTSGILGYVRHPLYSATILILAGFVLFSPKWTSIIFLGVTLMYLVIGIWLEERKLVKLYGDEYMDYKKQVDSLIPFKRLSK